MFLSTLFRCLREQAAREYEDATSCNGCCCSIGGSERRSHGAPNRPCHSSSYSTRYCLPYQADTRLMLLCFENPCHSLTILHSCILRVCSAEFKVSFAEDLHSAITVSYPFPHRYGIGPAVTTAMKLILQVLQHRNLGDPHRSIRRKPCMASASVR